MAPLFQISLIQANKKEISVKPHFHNITILAAWTTYTQVCDTVTLSHHVINYIFPSASISQLTEEEKNWKWLYFYFFKIYFWLCVYVCICEHDYRHLQRSEESYQVSGSSSLGSHEPPNSGCQEATSSPLKEQQALSCLSSPCF